MSSAYQIENVEKPEDSAWGIIGRGLQAFNVQQAGENQFQRLCFTLSNTEQEVVGGVLGETYWDWFHLDLLWVSEPLRGRGHGRRLLIQAEEEARKRGVKYAYLDTFSFQAPEFYLKHGYQVFGELSEFPPGHRRYFMKKAL